MFFVVVFVFFGFFKGGFGVLGVWVVLGVLGVLGFFGRRGVLGGEGVWERLGFFLVEGRKEEGEGSLFFKGGGVGGEGVVFLGEGRGGRRGRGWRVGEVWDFFWV